jgi:hypothetical protein
VGPRPELCRAADRQRDLGDRGRAQLSAVATVVRRSRILGYLLAGTLFLGLSGEGFDRLSQPRLAAELALPDFLTPQLWLGAVAVAVAVAVGSVALIGLTGRLVDPARPHRIGLLLVTVEAGAAAATIFFGLTGDVWFAIAAYLVAALLRQTAGPALNVWLVAGTSSGTPGDRLLPAVPDRRAGSDRRRAASRRGRPARLDGGGRGDRRRTPRARGALLRAGDAAPRQVRDLRAVGSRRDGGTYGR